MPAIGNRFGRKRPNYVVGFETGNFENRNSVCLERLPDIRNLLRQIAGHLAAIGFVLFVLLITESGRSHIEDCSEVLRRKVIPQFPQHINENVNRRRGKPFTSGHSTLPRHRVIGAEDE